MSPPIDSKTIETLATQPRWAALTRADEPLVAIRNWDRLLLRDQRVLVPVDVQALYVAANSDETFVHLPFALTTPDGKKPEDAPAPFDKGVKRPAGVHLHWAMPDALLVGTLESRDAGAENRLALPALPDRWVVLRLVVPRDATRATVAGWVIEADTTRVTPLADWPAADKARAATGKTVDADKLTGTVGGTLGWSAGYDAVLNRFAFYDDLSDIAAAAPNGVVGDFATYLVCGWWSSPALDPLDQASTPNGLRTRLDALKWRLTDDIVDRGADAKAREAKLTRQAAVTLNSGVRFASFSPALAKPVSVREGAGAAVTGLFAQTAASIGATIKSDPYSSLLHGVVHGVPVKGGVVADQRPKPDDARLALGYDSDDIAAVFAADGLALTDAASRRDVERLVCGFTHDRLSDLATTNGVAAIEESEHSATFSSRPGEPGPVERLRDPGTGSGLPGTRAARSAKAAGKGSRTAASALATSLLWSKMRRATVKSFTADKLRTVAESRSDAAAPAPTPATRLVRRPTPRYFEPLEPMLAIRGARRSLRHGFDNRRSPDGRLQCRWPSQVPVEVSGLIKGSDLVAEFPSGALPVEVATLMQSALVLDPYLASWRSDMAAAKTNLPRGNVQTRMFAESALRFRKDGAFSASDAVTALGGKSSPFVDAVLASSLNRFSLIAGVDPDPVGVTAWAQPWVPLWLEWSVSLDLSDRLDGWTLGAIDLETADGTDPAGGTTRTISGRSMLHGGVASTLGAAIANWMRAEDARDTQNNGEASEDVERQLADVAKAVGGIDILSASLDTLHDQLLGLPIGPYGLLAPRNPDGIGKPAPIGIPQLLVSGRLTVKAARLVDAFGRTLDLPVEKTMYPARDALVGATGTAMPPRLLRPARWLFRLVDPADASDAPAEATIDQVDPAAMINPVAGFLLPDHIDEALELFDTAGQPLGQLFHDPISGGVAWEIAPGRDGPPDSGPLFGLAPAQASLGQIAASVVGVDAQTRGGLPAKEDEESALSALLRAIDTTLWTVDTYAVLGSAHIAGPRRPADRRRPCDAASRYPRRYWRARSSGPCRACGAPQGLRRAGRSRLSRPHRRDHARRRRRACAVRRRRFQPLLHRRQGRA